MSHCYSHWYPQEGQQDFRSIDVFGNSVSGLHGKGPDVGMSVGFNVPGIVGMKNGYRNQADRNSQPKYLHVYHSRYYIGGSPGGQ